MLVSLALMGLWAARLLWLLKNDILMWSATCFDDGSIGFSHEGETRIDRRALGEGDKYTQFVKYADDYYNWMEKEYKKITNENISITAKTGFLLSEKSSPELHLALF